MHEVGIMQDALDMAFDRARADGARRILRMGMKIGVLSGVVPDALDFAFESLKAGTPAAEATLEIETVPITLYCGACAKAFAAEPLHYCCPDCGAPSADLRTGNELNLAWLELDDRGDEIE